MVQLQTSATGVDGATAQRSRIGAVLTASGEIDDAISGERAIRRRFEPAVSRRAILWRPLILATDRYRGGCASYIELLDTQRNLLQAKLDAITVRGEQVSNLVTPWAAPGGERTATGSGTRASGLQREG